MSSDVLTVEMIDELVKLAGTRQPQIRPACADDGRQFFIIHEPRERILERLQSGWTLQPVFFKDGQIVTYGYVEIERPRPFQTVHLDSESYGFA